DPNEPRVRHPDYGPARGTRPRGLTWEAYEPGTQLYLSLTQKPRMRSHYRGHKMALWLNLIPQLHQPGGDDVSMRHHNFRERAEHFYSGLVRAESFTRPPPPPPAPGSTPRTPSTECTPNSTAAPWDEDVVGVDEDDEDGLGGAGGPEDEAGLLRRLATRHYYSYTAALGVTVGVGCLLLVLNMLVFAGVFYRRRRRGGGAGGRAAAAAAE
ncbi:Neuroligin-4, X-linked, partial [Gryllus bimaculatus]